MSLRDRSNPTVAYSRPAATFIILHFPCVLFSEGGLGCIASQAVMKYAITIRKNKTGLEIILNRFVVPRTRLELTRANAHHPLKVACLPIPPISHIKKHGEFPTHAIKDYNEIFIPLFEHKTLKVLLFLEISFLKLSDSDFLLSSLP